MSNFFVHGVTIAPCPYGKILSTLHLPYFLDPDAPHPHLELGNRVSFTWS